ncbi:hypothetical protein RRG08_007515, partial [Elysia crispata]
NFGTVFVDQSYWQSAVASKPKQGVLGLLLGGLAWFAIPFSFSTTMGLAYVALSAKQGEALLTPDDVDAGLVPPVVAYHLLGKSGAILIMVMVLMAVTSTGSSEIMAVTSIIIYDIYALNLKHLNPLTMITGGFNRRNTSRALLSFQQYVTCATREEATLDVLYANVREAYTSYPECPLGNPTIALSYSNLNTGR